MLAEPPESIRHGTSAYTGAHTDNNTAMTPAFREPTVEKRQNKHASMITDPELSN